MQLPALLRRLACGAARTWFGIALTLLARGAAPADTALADADLAGYFRAEAERLGQACLAEVRSLADWQARQAEYRRQLQEMLGLCPWPARTPLQAVVTRRRDLAEYRVENLHFQSMPGLYVTANLYLPREASQPLPAILYVCGHAEVKTNGVSCGNKTAYQHHAIWFARHGYACLVLDTLQLGEIQGIHHGTHRFGMWWWNARGYTPAGIEAWNAIRALDYLETRPEVDPHRIGMTGRSGGGSYTWTTAALDERIRVAAPVAGITDLRNQVVDGCVEGHCDCMFYLNAYRWDFPLNAALIAPRPLLIVNTDRDTIFPLDGVVRVHAKTQRIYDLYGASTNLGLVIGPGPHQDTQDLQVPVFRWFNRHLKGEDPLIAKPATRELDPLELRAFADLPADEINTRVHEQFRPGAGTTSDGLIPALRRSVFGGWPEAEPSLELKTAKPVKRDRFVFRAVDFTSQAHVSLRLFLAVPAGRPKPTQTVLWVLDEPGWTEWQPALSSAFDMPAAPLGSAPAVPAGSRPGLDEALAWARTQRAALAWFAPRGVGPTGWNADPKHQVQIRRRFMLLGQTLEAMRVWDVRRAIQALGGVTETRGTAVTLRARGVAGVNALYAAVFEPQVTRLELGALPASHRDGPDYLNVLRYTDVPEMLRYAGRRQTVEIRD